MSATLSHPFGARLRPLIGGLAAAVLAFSGGCRSEPKPEAAATPPTSPLPATKPSPAPAPAAEPKAARTPTPDDLPGFPVDQLPLAAQQTLWAFAQDAFSYDGNCAVSLPGCLRQPGSKRHAGRMLTLAAAESVAGATAAEINTLLNGYYASFAPAKRTSFDLATAACTGSEAAPVTLIEFSDFECPHCAAARPLLQQFAKLNSATVRLCFKPFPLQIHPNSLPAAQAAMYAHAHGKFWELHDLMFENQNDLGGSRIAAYATQVGLDAKAMTAAIENGVYLAAVNASKEEGKKAGITGTPSVFMNGRPLVLPLGPGTLQHALEDELEWKSSGGKWAAQ